ncbi:MAG TPA: RDD family protein, partial [Armatimonadota bacterium]|nr:RDD family protein [Armatimonadota bacterium]
ALIWAALFSPVTSATDGILLLSWLFHDLPAVLIANLYGAAMEASPANATLGKMMTGCVVVDYAGEGLGFGKALWRNLVKYASLALTGGLAALLIFVSRTERTLHDSAANTYVIEKHAP